MDIPLDSPDSDLPLPLMVGGKEVRRSISYTPRHHAYVLRFTPEAQDDPDSQLYGFEEIQREVLEANMFDIYLLVKETTPKIHYHLYLECEYKHDELKKIIREFVYSYYHTRTRGFGTKYYSCLISENPLNAIIYNLKQVGRQEWSGFTSEFIDECRKMAFTTKENDFEKDIMTLTKAFLDNLSINPVDFGANLAKIYSQYDKRVHWKDIQGYVTSKLIKREPDQALTLASKYLSF